MNIKGGPNENNREGNEKSEETNLDADENDENETSLKSTRMNGYPEHRSLPGVDTTEHDMRCDRRRNSAIGVADHNSPDPVPLTNPNDHDISLNSFRSPDLVTRVDVSCSSSPQHMPTMCAPSAPPDSYNSFSSASQITPLNMPPSTRPTQLPTTRPEMNIPPSNRSSAEGIAEFQPSFQRVPPSVMNSLKAMNPNSNMASPLQDDKAARNDLPTRDPICLSSFPHHCNTLYNSSSLEDSSGDNNMCVSQTPARFEQPPRAMGPVQPSSAVGSIASQQHNCSQNNSALSHSYSRRFIPENIPVNKAPRKIIKYINTKLQGNVGKNWKDLVEMYGWDYQRTTDFEVQNSQSPIFEGLLVEPEFQTYTLSMLRCDLNNLPRLDILTELDEMIVQHNEECPQ